MTGKSSIQRASEPPSKPDHTVVATPPAIEFIGLKVFAERDGDHVTGRVVFPHPVGGDLTEAAKAYREGRRVTGRTECPIDYRSQRPDDESAIRNPQPASTPRSRLKGHAVQAYWTLCAKQPSVSRKRLAAQVVESARDDGLERISVRSLQVWADKVECEGWHALRDHYVKPTAKVPTFDVDHARQALMVCAWWSYRIGNADTIDTKLMAVAVALIEKGHPAADLLATIDCYYSWPCNREVYPFLPFARWVRYHLDRWLCRAAEANDYRHALPEGHTERTPLQTVDRGGDLDSQRSVSTTATRKRQTGTRRTRREIHKLAGADVETPPPAQSVEDPETIAEGLAGLDDQLRYMLLRAAGRDADPAARKARREAIATMPLWWRVMPTSITGDIDFRIDQWRRDHKTATDKAANQRRFGMFLPHLRNNRATECLAVAARMMA